MIKGGVKMQIENIESVSGNDTGSTNTLDLSTADFRDLLQLIADIKELTTNLDDSQKELSDFIIEELTREPTEEEIQLLEEKEQADLEYRESLLETLNGINAGVVSQNALLEENNRLLERSVSMNGIPVSDNSISQNAIMTTKLEDYSLTDSLLLVLIVITLISSLVGIFFRKGD